MDFIKDLLTTIDLGAEAKDKKATSTSTIVGIIKSIQPDYVYEITYGSSTYTAVSANRTSYKVGDVVYVLVPSGNDTKVILSLANITDTSNEAETAKQFADYDKNLIIFENSPFKQSIEVKADTAAEGSLLNSSVTIDQIIPFANFQAALALSNKLKISAKFTWAQKEGGNAIQVTPFYTNATDSSFNYGLKLVLNTVDGEKTYTLDVNNITGFPFNIQDQVVEVIYDINADEITGIADIKYFYTAGSQTFDIKVSEISLMGQVLEGSSLDPKLSIVAAPEGDVNNDQKKSVTLNAVVIGYTNTKFVQQVENIKWYRKNPDWEELSSNTYDITVTKDQVLRQEVAYKVTLDYKEYEADGETLVNSIPLEAEYVVENTDTENTYTAVFEKPQVEDAIYTLKINVEPAIDDSNNLLKYKWYTYDIYGAASLIGNQTTREFTVDGSAILEAQKYGCQVFYNTHFIGEDTIVLQQISRETSTVIDVKHYYTANESNTDEPAFDINNLGSNWHESVTEDWVKNVSNTATYWEMHLVYYNTGEIELVGPNKLYTNNEFEQLQSLTELYSVGGRAGDAPSNWNDDLGTALDSLNNENPYLWNYESLSLTGGGTQTDPAVIGQYGIRVMVPDLNITAKPLYAKKTDTGMSPETVTFMAESEGLVGDYLWKISDAKNIERHRQQAPSATCKITLDPDWAYPLTVSVSRDGLTDVYTFQVVGDGVDAITVIISNPQFTFNTDSPNATESTNIQVLIGEVAAKAIVGGTDASDSLYSFSITSVTSNPEVKINTELDNDNDTIIKLSGFTQDAQSYDIEINIYKNGKGYQTIIKTIGVSTVSDGDEGLVSSLDNDVATIGALANGTIDTEALKAVSETTMSILKGIEDVTSQYSIQWQFVQEAAGDDVSTYGSLKTKGDWNQIAYLETMNKDTVSYMAIPYIGQNAINALAKTFTISKNRQANSLETYQLKVTPDFINFASVTPSKEEAINFTFTIDYWDINGTHSALALNDKLYIEVYENGTPLENLITEGSSYTLDHLVGSIYFVLYKGDGNGNSTFLDSATIANTTNQGDIAQIGQVEHYYKTVIAGAEAPLKTDDGWSVGNPKSITIESNYDLYVKTISTTWSGAITETDPIELGTYTQQTTIYPSYQYGLTVEPTEAPSLWSTEADVTFKKMSVYLDNLWVKLMYATSEDGEQTAFSNQYDHPIATYDLANASSPNNVMTRQECCWTESVLLKPSHPTADAIGDLPSSQKEIQSDKWYIVPSNGEIPVIKYAVKFDWYGKFTWNDNLKDRLWIRKQTEYENITAVQIIDFSCTFRTLKDNIECTGLKFIVGTTQENGIDINAIYYNKVDGGTIFLCSENNGLALDYQSAFVYTSDNYSAITCYDSNNKTVSISEEAEEWLLIKLKDWIANNSNLLEIDPTEKVQWYRWTRTATIVMNGIGNKITYSSPVLSESDRRIVEWCSANDTVFIDGGEIYAHSVNTEQLKANAIRSYNYPVLDGTKDGEGGATNETTYYDYDPAVDYYKDNKNIFPAQGSFFDLEHGEIFTPGFKVYSVTENGEEKWKAGFKGYLEANEGGHIGAILIGDSQDQFSIRSGVSENETVTLTQIFTPSTSNNVEITIFAPLRATFKTIIKAECEPVITTYAADAPPKLTPSWKSGGEGFSYITYTINAIADQTNVIPQYTLIVTATVAEAWGFQLDRYGTFTVQNKAQIGNWNLNGHWLYADRIGDDNTTYRAYLRSQVYDFSQTEEAKKYPPVFGIGTASKETEPGIESGSETFFVRANGEIGGKYLAGLENSDLKNGVWTLHKNGFQGLSSGGAYKTLIHHSFGDNDSKANESTCFEIQKDNSSVFYVRPNGNLFANSIETDGDISGQSVKSLNICLPVHIFKASDSKKEMTAIDGCRLWLDVKYLSSHSSYEFYLKGEITPQTPNDTELGNGYQKKFFTILLTPS